MAQQKIISISSGTMIRFVFLILLLAFIYIIRDIVAIVFISIVIASAVLPAVKWLEKLYFPRVAGVIAIYLISFIILGAIFYFVLPPLFFETADFFNTFPGSAKEIPEKIMPGFYEKIGVSNSFSGVFDNFRETLSGFLPQFSKGFFGTIASIFGGVVSFILIIILSFYLSVQEGGIENFLRIIMPEKYESYALSVWKRSERKIAKWLRGQILLGVFVGMLVFLGLTILKIKYAVSLALVAALFEIIPVFGPILASIPAIIIGFLKEPWFGFAVLIMYVIIQQFENHLIYPLVIKKIIGIPPILVILSFLIGAKLAGFIGILLSIPVAVVAMEILNDIAEKKKIVL